MRIYSLSILSAAIAVLMTSCNEAPEIQKELQLPKTKSSEPKAVTSEVAKELAGKVFTVSTEGSQSDAELKAGIDHYIIYHSASW